MSASLTSDQIFAFYKSLLQAMLQKHAPDGVSTISGLLKKFPGREHLVYVQICKKCKVEPRDPPTLDDFENGVPKLNQQPANSSDGIVSKWLTENNFEKYAKMHQFSIMTWENFISINSRGILIELGVLPKHAHTLLTAISKATEEKSDQTEGKGEPLFTADFEVGENCFTKVVLPDDEGAEKWLKARVTGVNNDNTFDIFVYNAQWYGVPPEAVSVPRKMLKKSSENVEVAEPKHKQANNYHPMFHSGDRIRVFGLRSHPTYNNLFGTVLIYVPNERRYQVRLDTNDVIAIKQRNVAPENSDPQIAAALEHGRKKFRNDGGSKSGEGALSELIIKLMNDKPNADPKKLGEFAAGYLIAKQKLSSSEGS